MGTLGGLSMKGVAIYYCSYCGEVKIKPNALDSWTSTSCCDDETNSMKRIVFIPNASQPKNELDGICLRLVAGASVSSDTVLS